MTHYRPSTAICHWRHLTVIATDANVNGTPVTGAQVTQAKRAELVEGCRLFTKHVIDYSEGMCWLQHDLFWFPGEWTLGDSYTAIVPEGYLTSLADLKTGCLTVGVRTDGYDSIAMLGPDLTYTLGASGLSFADVSGTHAYYHFMPYGLAGTTTAPFMGDVQTHEWGHTLDLYFDEFGLGAATMPHPDHPTNYRHADGTPLDPTDLSRDFLRAMFTGDIEDIATSTQQGCSAAIWELGPVRKNYPQ
jgi:hypothetical protein